MTEEFETVPARQPKVSKSAEPQTSDRAALLAENQSRASKSRHENARCRERHEGRSVMTPEELDEAITEGLRDRGLWTPPEPVDPDVEAYWRWHKSVNPTGRLILNVAAAFLAGARMAREQERERAKVLLDYAWEDVGAPGGDEAKARSNRAFDIITKYEKGDQ